MSTSSQAGVSEKALDSAGFVKFKAFDRQTGEFKGWLGTADNDACLVADVKDAIGVQWVNSDTLKYLAKESSPARYLGLDTNSYVSWGLWTGDYKCAVQLQADGTISMKEDSKRRLYGPYRKPLGSTDWLCWSDNNDNDNILRFEVGN